MNPRDQAIPKEVEEALASLNLPQMPSFSGSSAGFSSSKSSSSSGTSCSPAARVEPTITILVVADLDLLSASALSEYTLENQLSVDLCIACGSFCRDEDLHPYLRGSQRRRGGAGDPHYRSAGSGAGSAGAPVEPGWASTPLFRAREQTAALEGLMTATLSQLENIVCRVVYCPGSSDPLTCLIHQHHQNRDACAGGAQQRQHHPRRLTPNSRNLHQQWLPLAPGLGAAALLYLDCSEHILLETRDNLTRWHAPPLAAAAPNAASPPSLFTLTAPPSPPHPPSASHHPDDASDEDEQGAEEAAFWVDQLQHLQHNSGRGYRETLERLLRLAPPAQPALPLVPSPAQTILVTHYVDCTPLVSSSSSSHAAGEAAAGAPPPAAAAAKNDDSEDFWPANGCPVWALPTHDDGNDEKDDEVDDPRPWPGDEHARFHNSDLARERLCLEIASGSSASHLPRLLRRGRVRNDAGSGRASSSSSTDSAAPVLLPGSLRERGEFSVVHVSLVPDDFGGGGGSSSNDAASHDGKPPPRGVGRHPRKGTASATAAAPPAAPGPTPASHPAAKPTANKRAYSWVVQNVDFYKLSERKA